MTQILGFFLSAEIKYNVIEGIPPVSSWVLLAHSLGHEFDPHFELVMFLFEIFRQD